MRVGKGWQRGRQRSGYDKLLLVELGCCDAYLLRFSTGARVPPHRDLVDGRRHYRLNLILRPAERGGVFVCDEPIVDRRRVKLFRSDRATHSVTEVEAGTRWVLSLGIAI